MYARLKQGVKAAAARQTPRSPIAVRFLDEILLASGQYALFYVLMNFADERVGRLLEISHMRPRRTLLDICGDRFV